MTSFLGIDPGLTGAIGLFRGEQPFDVVDLPVVGKTWGKGRELDAVGLVNLLRGHGVGAGWLACVEQVHAMPNQGVSSTFSLGDTNGVIRASLAALGAQLVPVRPYDWKKRAGLIGKDKDASRGLALKYWPHLAHNLGRKKDDGRAEALLIGYFGRPK